MYSKYTAHVRSKGSHFLTAGFLVYCTYKVSKIGADQTWLKVSTYSKYTAYKSSNGSWVIDSLFRIRADLRTL